MAAAFAIVSSVAITIGAIVRSNERRATGQTRISLGGDFNWGATSGGVPATMKGIHHLVRWMNFISKLGELAGHDFWVLEKVPNCT